MQTTTQLVSYNDLYLDNTSLSSKDLILAVNVAAIQTALNNIFMTKETEFPMNAQLGLGPISEFLFAPLDIVNAYMLKEYILNALELNEPRISNIYVEVGLLSDQGYKIDVFYNIINNNQTQTFSTIFSNVR